MIHNPGSSCSHSVEKDGEAVFLGFGVVSAQSEGLQTCSFARASPTHAKSPLRPAALFSKAPLRFDGTLWIGDEGGHLAQYKNGQLKNVDFHAAWIGGKPYDLEADEAGQIWAINAAGQLARAKDGLVWNPKAGAVANLVHIARCSTGRIWVDRWGPGFGFGNCRLQALGFGGSPEANYVQGIGAGQDGSLWVACDELGLMPWGGSPVTLPAECLTTLCSASL